MSFLYFVETDQFQGTLEDVARAGLTYAFEAPPLVRASTMGPGEKPGFVVSVDDELGYYPIKQTWRRMSNVECRMSNEPRPIRWVGKTTGREIAPAELCRRRTLNGHRVTLADGREWLCPAARKLVDSLDGAVQWHNALPHRWDVDDAGRWIMGSVLPRYAELWEEVEWVWDYFKRADGGTAVDGQKAGHAAALALGANYRVGPVECGLLSLIDDQTVFEVLGALIDWPTLLEWDKKKRNSELVSST